jgi:hypothetical protein
VEKGTLNKYTRKRIPCMFSLGWKMGKIQFVEDKAPNNFKAI